MTVSCHNTDPVPAEAVPPNAFELEYVIAHGRTTGQLPAVSDGDLVARVVRIYAAALPPTGR
jgi:hypothetical protein